MDASGHCAHRVKRIAFSYAEPMRRKPNEKDRLKVLSLTRKRLLGKIKRKKLFRMIRPFFEDLSARLKTAQTEVSKHQRDRERRSKGKIRRPDSSGT